MAQGSASEVETELLIAQRLGYFDEQNYTDIRAEIDRIGRLLTGLLQHLKQKEEAKQL
jgi:four helix bundle protein